MLARLLHQTSERLLRFFVWKKSASRSGYRLRPARLRKAPRLYPGMISSLLPPRRPAKPCDAQPDCPTEFVAGTTTPVEDTNTISDHPTLPTNLPDVFRTAPNSFGLVHEYYCSAELLKPIAAGLRVTNSALHRTVDCGYTKRVLEIIHPFQNLSIFRFAHWFYTGGGNDAQGAANRLIKNVICAPDFDPRHFQGVNIQAINNALDSIDDRTSLEQISQAGDGWKTSTVTISIPTGQRSGPARPTTLPEYEDPSTCIPVQVPGLHHRSLLDIIRTRFSNPLCSRGFVYTPYKVFQTRPGAEDVRVRDELYTSDAWIEEHKRIQQLEILDDSSGMICRRERGIVALMVWSDPTQVTQFSQTSVSPVYVYFGNQPKRE